MAESTIAEQWKPIAGFEDRYEISDLGRVYSHVSGRCVHITVNNCGYETVSLCRHQKAQRHLVHRLMAVAFIPNPHNKPQVNHRDGIKNNNAMSNLEWATRSENIKHGYATGLIPRQNGKVVSPETRIRMSAALIGRVSPCGMRGKTHTPETRARMSESQRAHWATKRRSQ